MLPPSLRSVAIDNPCRTLQVAGYDYRLRSGASLHRRWAVPPIHTHRATHHVYALDYEEPVFLLFHTNWAKPRLVVTTPTT